jgi:hypothetical protein
MYMGCSGATCIYTSCLTGRARLCTKIYIFNFGVNKKGTSNLQREMEGHPSKMHGVRQNLL